MNAVVIIYRITSSPAWLINPETAEYFAYDISRGDFYWNPSRASRLLNDALTLRSTRITEENKECSQIQGLTGLNCILPSMHPRGHVLTHLPWCRSKPLGQTQESWLATVQVEFGFRLVQVAAQPGASHRYIIPFGQALIEPIDTWVWRSIYKTSLDWLNTRKEAFLKKPQEFLLFITKSGQLKILR